MERKPTKVAEEHRHHCRQVKNIPLKKIAKMSSWRIENREDVDCYVEELRQKLVSELDGDAIVNVEF